MGYSDAATRDSIMCPACDGQLLLELVCGC